MSQINRDLSAMTEALGAGIDKFERRVAKAAARRAMRRRIGPLPTRLPSTRAHRPTRHPAGLPRRYDRRRIRTVLDRVRTEEERRHGGPSALVAAARRAAGRVADAVRSGLGKLRRGLSRLRGRSRGSR